MCQREIVMVVLTEAMVPEHCFSFSGLRGEVLCLPGFKGSIDLAQYGELRVVLVDTTTVRSELYQGLFEQPNPTGVVVVPVSLTLPGEGCIGLAELEKCIEKVSQGLFQTLQDVILPKAGQRALPSSLEIEAEERRRLQVEQRLNLAVLRYQRLVNSAPFCIVEIDLSGCLTAVNGAGMSLFDMGFATTFKGMAFSEMVQPEEQPMVSHLIQQAVGGEAGHGEFVANSCKAFNLSLVPICDSEGATLWLMGFCYDISAQKVAEQSLELHQQNLEALVDVRSQELAEVQAKLADSERLASLGKLTATVAHEISNPLGAVSNAVFSIQHHLKSKNEARVLSCIEMAERNVRRCSRIIDELLGFSERIELKLETVHIDAWVQQAVESYEFPQGISWGLSLSASVALRLDVTQLGRAFENVLENAVHAVQHNEGVAPVIRVSTQVSGERCEIRLTDSGNGIAEENLEHIFEPLFSTKMFGIGLGIPVVKSIMEEHGGGLAYINHKTQGVTAVMWLPLRH